MGSFWIRVPADSAATQWLESLRELLANWDSTPEEFGIDLTKAREHLARGDTPEIVASKLCSRYLADTEKADEWRET